MRKIWFAFVLVSVLVGVATFARSAVFYVSPTSDADCSDFDCDFRSALNAASLNDEGDTIYLGAGTYDASASQFVWNTTKNFPLTIIGSDGTIIDGGGTSQCMYIDTTNQPSDTNSHVTIQSVTFQNGSNPLSNGGGLFAITLGADVTIERCKFNGNTSQWGGGAQIYSPGSVAIRNNVFHGNTAPNIDGGGISVIGNPASTVIEGNLFYGNSAQVYGGAISVDTYGAVDFVNNVVYTNTATFGSVLITTADVATINNNTLAFNSGNGGGCLWVNLITDSAVANIYNNIIWNEAGMLYGDIRIGDRVGGSNVGVAVNLYNNDFADFFSDCSDNIGCAPQINQANNKNVNPQLANVTDPDPANWDLRPSLGSEVIDFGDATMCAATDIRAVSRPQDGNKDGINICDMGAYEVMPVELSALEGTIGTMLAITGSGFGDKKGKVLIDNTAAKIINWSPASITTEIKKALSPGIAYDVVVKPREPKGIAPITLTKAFTMMEPVITSVDPGTGTEGIAITIRGNYFSTKKGKVYLGEKKCKVLSWGMDKITFTVPKKMTPGPYDVTVTNKVGLVTLTDGFVIP